MKNATSQLILMFGAVLLLIACDGIEPLEEVPDVNDPLVVRDLLDAGRIKADAGFDNGPIDGGSGFSDGGSLFDSGQPEIASDAGEESFPDDAGEPGRLDGGSSGVPDAGHEPPPACDDTAPANRLNSAWDVLPTTHTLIRSGSALSVELGVADGFSGIGSELRIRNAQGVLSGNMIEARSGAGAAHQFTLFGTQDNTLLVMNQAAGNSAGQWGYASCLWEKNSGTVLEGQRWLPMMTDEYRTGGAGGASTATAPFLNGAAQSRQVLSGLPIWKLTSIDAGDQGQLIQIEKTWKIRNPSNVNIQLTDEISWDALYHRPQFSIDHNMRLIYAWRHANGDASYDVITPHAPMGATEDGTLMPNRLFTAPTGTVQYEYIPRPYGKWAIHTFPANAGYLDYLVYVFEVGDETVGIALTPPVRGRTAFAFVGQTYPEQAGEHFGTIHLYSIFEEGQLLALQPGEERDYTIRYFAGSLPQLAAAGFTTGNTTPIETCSGCLGSWESCVNACYDVMGGTGYCAVPGSQDPNSCCACF